MGDGNFRRIHLFQFATELAWSLIIFQYALRNEGLKITFLVFFPDWWYSSDRVMSSKFVFQFVKIPLLLKLIFVLKKNSSFECTYKTGRNSNIWIPDVISNIFSRRHLFLLLKKYFGTKEIDFSQLPCIANNSYSCLPL